MKSKFINIDSKFLDKELSLIKNDNSLVLFTDPSLETGNYKNYFVESLNILKGLITDIKFSKVCIIGELLGKTSYYDSLYNSKYLHSHSVLWTNGCEKRIIYLYSNTAIRKNLLNNQLNYPLENSDTFQCAVPKDLILDIYNALDIKSNEIIIDPFAGSNNICYYIAKYHNNRYISAEIQKDIYEKAIIYKPK